MKRGPALLLALLLSGPAAPAGDEPARRIEVTAKRFEFSPRTLELVEGEPVLLELRTLDRAHGFSVPELGIEVEVKPGAPVQLRLVPQKAGTFEFHCHLFCGSGHEEMTGQIKVRPKR
jgi:cytochrome c oxidase subunit 2